MDKERWDQINLQKQCRYIIETLKGFINVYKKFLKKKVSANNNVFLLVLNAEELLLNKNDNNLEIQYDISLLEPYVPCPFTVMEKQGKVFCNQVA